MQEQVSGENALMQHGKGNSVGVFRLGVTPFGRAASAQDDRFNE
jgi:hypothetical protein